MSYWLRLAQALWSAPYTLTRIAPRTRRLRPRDPAFHSDCSAWWKARRWREDRWA